jgi:hypothetical protein
MVGSCVSSQFVGLKSISVETRLAGLGSARQNATERQDGQRTKPSVGQVINQTFLFSGSYRPLWSKVSHFPGLWKLFTDIWLDCVEEWLDHCNKQRETQKHVSDKQNIPMKSQYNGISTKRQDITP